MIISRTPFRISFFGGGTDYPVWYRRHGGNVLGTSINKYCYLTCRYLPPFFEHRIRLVYSNIENRQTIDEIEHPAVREVLRYLNFDRGLEIHHDGDLPARSGIGSSSAFTVGLLHALYGLKGHMPSKNDLAMESIYIEQDRLKETVGSQDQVLAAYGGFNHVTFHPNNTISINPLTLPNERIEELDSHLLLFYTGIKRTASDIAQSYVEDMKKKEAMLFQMNDFVKEGLRILKSGDEITRFGKLLHDAWQIKKSLGNRISNAFVEEMYDAAVAAGAIGGKLLGAGGGGFLLLFAHPANHEKIRESLEKLIYVPFKFEFSGSNIIFFEAGEDYTQAEGIRLNQTIDSFQELSKD